MAQFVLIDHSLKSVGGHHYDYAVNLLNEASSAGYEVVLATHRRFRADRDPPSDWRVFRLFPHDTYSPYAVYVSSRSRASETGRCERPGDSTGKTSLIRAAAAWLSGWRERMIQADRRKRLDGFADACGKLFRQVQLHEDDHVFVPTLSEFDLAGLVQYLRRDAESQRACWHLQFHFNIFEGREPDYDRQEERFQQMRRAFEESLGGVSQHRLHLYNTSAQLSGQYNRLGVAEFQTLAYPVRSAFRPRDRGRDSSQPLRMACAGAIRREKGQRLLADLVSDLWEDYLSAGRLQLHIQSNKSWFRLPVPPRRPAVGQAANGAQVGATDPVVYVPHPLNATDYVDFIRGSDIGLMLYDSDRYYVRVAGVLGELLSAGVPVIVPAGCWLSEQIAEPIYRHVERLGQELPVVGRLTAGDIVWRTEGDGDGAESNDGSRLTFGGPCGAASGEAPVPAGANELLLRFRWVHPTEPGAYVRFVVEQQNTGGETVRRQVIIVGHRSSGEAVPALTHLASNAARVRITWDNAYHELPITVDDWQARFLSNGVASQRHSQRPSQRHCPAGAVGLIAADRDQVGDLVREMVDHYDHYRETATDFSAAWRQAHHPQKTLADLLAQTDRRVPTPACS